MAAGLAGREHRHVFQFGNMILEHAENPALRPLVGRKLADIAAERSCTPLEVFLDTLAADCMRSYFVTGGDIGDDPESFVRQLITGISVQEGRPGLLAYMTGVGLTIADEMPPEFWTLFQEIAQLAASESRQPTLFLLSEEPYVPWELAIVNEQRPRAGVTRATPPPAP